MVFVSLVFLFAFLPAVLGVYYFGRREYRNWVLLAFSWAFYFWGSGKFLLILILSTAVNYGLGLLIDRYKNSKNAGYITALAVAVNLCTLAYFKYANFFIGEANGALIGMGLTPVRWTYVLLPIGISFFIFHNITYVVDVYRGTKRAFTNFVNFALYIAFFPQLIAGPIVRFHEISDQITGRKETLDAFYHGVIRFSWGVMKKVILANSCAEIADKIFSLAPGMLDTKLAWLGVLSYTLQIYFDFSGYSDMAVGLGLMFGFKLPENFNRPYSAVSITDFWRRWHISLSNFFREYVYIPLGGNRRGDKRTYFNLMTVFVLCGLWHGANWTFLVWGIYHGSLLMIERFVGLREPDTAAYTAAKRTLTLLLVVVGWVFFRAANLGQAFDFLWAMFIPVNHIIPWEIMLALNNRNLIFFFLASLVVFAPRNWQGYKLMYTEKGGIISVLQTGALMVVLFYSISLVTSGSYNPFIYFKF